MAVMMSKLVSGLPGMCIYLEGNCRSDEQFTKIKGVELYLVFVVFSINLTLFRKDITEH